MQNECVVGGIKVRMYLGIASLVLDKRLYCEGLKVFNEATVVCLNYLAKGLRVCYIQIFNLYIQSISGMD